MTKRKDFETNNTSFENDPIILSKNLLDTLLEYDCYADLIGLYLYYHFAIHQKIIINTKSIAQNLAWSENRVRKSRRILQKLNLIEEIHVSIENGGSGFRYTKINTI